MTCLSESVTSGQSRRILFRFYFLNDKSSTFSFFQFSSPSPLAQSRVTSSFKIPNHGTTVPDPSPRPGLPDPGSQGSQPSGQQKPNFQQQTTVRDYWHNLLDPRIPARDPSQKLFAGTLLAAWILYYGITAVVRIAFSITTIKIQNTILKIAESFQTQIQLWQLIQFSPWLSDTNIHWVQSIWLRNEAYILFSCCVAWSIIVTELAPIQYDAIQCQFFWIAFDTDANEYSEISVSFDSVLQIFWNSAYGPSIVKSIFLWKLSNPYAIAPESSQIDFRLFEMNRCKFTHLSLMKSWCYKSAILKSANSKCFSSQKSPFLIEIQTIFNPKCSQSHLRCVIRFIKHFILLCEILNWSRNSRKFCWLGAKICFFAMVRCKEFIISHRNSNHLQSRMSLKSSKMCDSIYQNFIWLSEVLNRLTNSRKFVAWVQKLRFFVMLRFTEITISHWISNHPQSWMSLE